MYDVIALGELLIDFAPEGSDLHKNLFLANPGGAPANVLVALSKMGRRTAFIGKVGLDKFGTSLKETLESYEIDTTGLVFSDNVKTTLAFVHLDESGDRSFSFYRNPGADMTLNENEVRYDLIRQARIFHFGSLSMTNEPARAATLKAVEFAKQFGGLISYDPNLRLPLWSSSDEAKTVIVSALSYADILKVSEEELFFLTRESDVEIGSRILQKSFGLNLILVTLGAQGCFYRLNGESAIVPGIKVNTVDTTGAGDAFVAAILHKISDDVTLNNVSQLSRTRIKEYVSFANVVAALSTTKKGGIPSMPSMAEINNHLLGIS
ncbi:carbohydrate kinase [Fodinisporobacter ferrooxydans]|uniref:Carbohydrate kinase n=1 Tax=Fodinisporobacter ferrooxydans TaxID=2901836 RepID=A0ABY4CHQ8_9BACL|nr:carbohydrate kinase [Alicyclobacillaceae bacterium MYW30-H2]